MPAHFSQNVLKTFEWTSILDNDLVAK